MNFCFVSEANYSNYTRRLKDFNLKRFLELDLDIPFYISTNLAQEFKEYKDNPLVSVFNIDDLRINNNESLKYELLPDNPKGIYPALYPWNLRRFILRKAAQDGYNALIFLECDTRVRENIDKQQLINRLTELYESNTVKTSSTRFVYKNRQPSQQLFYNHQNYIDDLHLNFSDDRYDTLDGTNQLFFADDFKNLDNFFNIWDFITNYGYEKPYGYKTGYLSNLSFVIPMSNFVLKHSTTPFETKHVFNDRY